MVVSGEAFDAGVRAGIEPAAEREILDGGVVELFSLGQRRDSMILRFLRKEFSAILALQGL